MLDPTLHGESDTPLYESGGVHTLGAWDLTAETYLVGDRILRGIHREYTNYYRHILQTCIEEDLFSRGIVVTWENHEKLLPDVGYELILEHERVPFVSYPYEWPQSMIRDAVLFHIRLNLALLEKNLVLRDMHLKNILFTDTKPVFIDFTSLRWCEDLVAITPLRKILNRFMDPHLVYYLTVLYPDGILPNILRPLLMVSRNRFAHHRPIARYKEKMGIGTITAFLQLQGYLVTASLIRLRLTRELLKDPDRKKTRFWEALQGIVQQLQVPQLPPPHMTQPDRVLNDLFTTIVQQYHPSTVLVWGTRGNLALDIARVGSRVIAMDEDEASIENLYCTARDEGLSVLPLVMEVAQIVSNRNIWTLSVQSRIRCELGCVSLEVWKSANLRDRIPPDRFAACLAAITTRAVMLALPAGDGNGIRGALQQYFTSVETIPHPDSALQVLVCRKQPGTSLPSMPGGTS